MSRTVEGRHSFLTSNAADYSSISQGSALDAEAMGFAPSGRSSFSIPQKITELIMGDAVTRQSSVSRPSQRANSASSIRLVERSGSLELVHSLENQGSRTISKKESVAHTDEPTTSAPMYERCLPVGIKFENVTMDIQIQNPDAKCQSAPCHCGCEQTKPKRILQGISGEMKPGRMVALMGASGAGKSTLLNVLTKRVERGVCGTIHYNNMNPSAEQARAVSCFIQQEDLFFSSVTVMEQLSSQAKLRLHKKISKETRKSRVTQILKQMNLTKCVSTLVGNPALGRRGISGGERKRLSVGCEIITSPSVIFADEPTTGLDSFMAEQICKRLRELADCGRTVIATIHQPASRTFMLFDEICLMAEGRILYFGDLFGVIEWFNLLGFKCPILSNPADFVVKLCGIPEGTKREAKIQLLENWAAKWVSDGAQFIAEWKSHRKQEFVEESRRELKAQSALAAPQNQDNLRKIESMSIGVTEAEEAPSISFRTLESSVHLDPSTLYGKVARVNPFKELGILSRRAWICNIRDPLVFWARLTQTIILGIIFGSIFYQLDWSAHGAQSRFGCSFTVLMNQSILGSTQLASTFTLDRPIIQREYESGVIRPFVYMFAKIIVDFPIQIFFPILFNLIMYFMTALGNGGIKFLITTGILLLTANAAMSMGYVAAAVAPDADVALVVINLLMMPMMLFSGFIVKLDGVPKWIRWLQWISFFRYGFSAFTTTIFHDETVTLADGQEVDGQQFLIATLGVKESDFWIDIGVLLGMIVVIRVIGAALFVTVSRLRKENV